MLTLILASQSPRRKDLLKEAGYCYIDLPVNLSEIPDKNLNLERQIIKIAEEKALACYENYNYLKNQDYLILAADTMVVLDGKCLGKPKNFVEAEDFLTRLSGKPHEVKTAIYLLNCQTLEQDFDIATTSVHFRKLSSIEIHNYIVTGEPMDKAGAYGIQGLGGEFVSKVEGAIDNVIGLPRENLRLLLLKHQWNLKMESESKS